jgi:c(7)-type cytochrome triheme protein
VTASGWRRRVTVILILLVSSVALAAAFPAVLRIPPKKTTPPQALPWAMFSHRSHETYGCYACHPAVFPQRLVGFTHQEMQQAQFCGRCHDGAIAFAIPTAACGRCHVDAH